MMVSKKAAASPGRNRGHDVAEGVPGAGSQGSRGLLEGRVKPLYRAAQNQKSHRREGEDLRDGHPVDTKEKVGLEPQQVPGDDSATPEPVDEGKSKHKRGSNQGQQTHHPQASPYPGSPRALLQERKHQPQGGGDGSHDQGQVKAGGESPSAKNSRAYNPAQHQTHAQSGQDSRPAQTPTGCQCGPQQPQPQGGQVHQALFRVVGVGVFDTDEEGRGEDALYLVQGEDPLHQHRLAQHCEEWISDEEQHEQRTYQDAAGHEGVVLDDARLTQSDAHHQQQRSQGNKSAQPKWHRGGNQPTHPCQKSSTAQPHQGISTLYQR